MTESAMKVEIENLSEVKRKLRIEVPSTEVTQEMDRAYRQLGKRAKVKGFRPGKVPRSVLEMYYRKEIEQEVSDILVRRSLGEALKDKDLDPINLSWPEAPPPVVSGQDYRYSVELEVPPEFSAQDYLGLKLEAPEVEVTDDEVDKRLDEIRESGVSRKATSWSWITRVISRESPWKAPRRKGPTSRWAVASSMSISSGTSWGLKKGPKPALRFPCPMISPILSLPVR